MTAVSTTDGNGVVAGPKDDQQAPRPWKYEFRSSKAFIIAVVSIAIFADVFIYGMVIPLIPAILRDRLQMPDSELQKWMSILLAVFGGATLIGSPILGYLADKGASRKIPFVFGLLAVAGSTVMFWMARSPAPLVIARFLQGLSTAAVWIVGNALIIDTMGKDQLGTAMGYVSMALTIGTLAGPALGGVMLDRVGYNAVFILALSLIGVDIVLRLLMIESTRATKMREVDVEVSEPLLGHSDNRRYQTTEDRGRLVHELEPNKQRVSRSSIPPILRLAMSGQLLVVLIASIVDSIIYNMFESVLPVFVIRTFHWTSLGIGLCFFALSVPSLFSPVVGYFVDRYGPRIASFLGFVLLVPVLVVFQFVTDDSLNSQVLFFVLLCVAGVSFTAQLVALMVEVSEPVERKEQECPGIFGEKGAVAQAYALHNMAWACGQLVGPILAGGLAETAGWTVMVIVLAAISGATAILLAGTNEKVSGLLWKKPGPAREETGAN